MSGTKTTIRDVARKAGVSTATVSRYLNNSRSFSQNIKDNIQNAIDFLNYVPNENARSLKHNKTNVVGIIVPDMVVYSYIMKEIEQRLYDYGYSVIMANSGFDPARESVLLQNLLRQRVDGVLLASCGRNAAQIRSMEEQGIPVVLFDRYLEDMPDMPYVLEKGKECERRIVEYALSQGHTRIAYIQGPSAERVSNERFLEFLKILDEHGIAQCPRFYYPDVTQTERIKLVSNDILNHLNEVSLVITTNGKQIKNFIMAAHERKMEIPRDISITGFGLEEYKTLFLSPITCIIQNHKGIGKACSEKILELIENPNQIGKRDIIEIESEFFIGESVKKIS